MTTKFFPGRLVVLVTDSTGHGVPNVPVTFTLPSSGASAVPWGPTTVLSNASGHVAAPYMSANGKTGTYIVWATSSAIPSAYGYFFFTNTKN